MVTTPRNFWQWSVSDIDHRQIGACCACSKCGTFLFAPIRVVVLWPQYREKIAQHMLLAIAALHFPICALKSCPAPAEQGRVTISPLPHTTSPFKPPYHGKAVNPVSFFLFFPLLLLETVGKLLKHCLIGPSNSSLPCWKQLTWWQCHGTFGTGAFPILTTDRYKWRDNHKQSKHVLSQFAT